MGHFANVCQIPQKNPRCGKCKKFHGSNESCKPPEANVRRLGAENRDKWFTKEIVVQSKPYNAFIDTGSQASIVRKSVAEGINADRRKCPIQMKGICGGTRILDEAIIVDIAIDDMTTTAQVYIAEDELLQEDFLLGQDVIVNTYFTLKFENGQMIFDNNRVLQSPISTANAFSKFLHNVENDDDKAKLSKLLETYADVFSTGHSFDEMHEKLGRILEVLRNCGLTLNIEKCEFFKQTITFLGHQIHPEGISPGEIKTNAIALFPTPNNVTEEDAHELDTASLKIGKIIIDEADWLFAIQLQKLREDAAARINDQRAEAKKRYDAKHSKPTIYETGDLVLVENEPYSTGTSRKGAHYKGPFLVSKVLPHDRYLIEESKRNRGITTPPDQNAMPEMKQKRRTRTRTSAADSDANRDNRHRSECVTYTQEENSAIAAKNQSDAVSNLR
ncbi:hypothetical protein ACLKA6_008314 [Drosophila palustris]